MPNKERSDIQIRTRTSEFKTRAEGDEKIIEGYFVVFGQETELWPGAFEEVSPTAFDSTLGNDIRALTNHDTSLVLGRTKSGTLVLNRDDHGLYGKIIINQSDTDAVNTYERIKRGDIDQCSFGFNVTRETTDWRDDGTVKWTLEEIDLHEVSCCTFPAYEGTSIQARHNEVAQYKEKQIEQRKNKLKGRIRNGFKTNNDPKTN